MTQWREWALESLTEAAPGAPAHCPLCGSDSVLIGEHDDEALGGATWRCEACRASFYIIIGIHRQETAPKD